MEVPREDPAEEIKRLRRCINDLVSVLALPAMSSGGGPLQIARTFLDVLLGLLSLDLVYVRLSDSVDEVPVEMIRVAHSRKQMRPQEIRELLDLWLRDSPQMGTSVIPVVLRDGTMALAPLRLGLQGEIGVIVAGSQRTDFPTQTERLLLTVAVNQAAIALQEARLLNEQKRVSNDLDRRVAERTRELAAVNEELKTEIAERRLAEDRLRYEQSELKRSEARKAAILDSALHCIVTMDNEGRITEFSPVAERTFGFRKGELIGKPVADVIILPLLQEQHQGGLARYFATSESGVLGKRIETIAIRADGREFPVELAITRTPLDGPPSFTVYLRDITDRKRSEQELRRSEAFLAEAQHISSTGSFLWQVATGEITWSEEMYRIFELDQSVAVTLDLVRARVHPYDIPLFNEMIDWARSTGNDFDYEHRLQMPDHSVKYLHVVAHGTRDKEGRLEYIGAIQNVTERRLSQEALCNARSELARVARVTALGALTASIAHEVNQPLAGILTNANTCLRMLTTDSPNIEGARETARRTIRDAIRASDVIVRLRAFFVKKNFTTESIDLNEATREVIALSLSELQRDRVVLQLELSDDLPPVTGDRVELQQVILNLLLNASEAMRGIDDRPRRLVLRTEHDEGNCVRLAMQDEGVGLEPRDLDRVFDPFYSTKSGGMGIGLSVSRSIIENHHGRLWATPNDGPGVTFSFSLPRWPEGVRQASRALGSVVPQAVIGATYNMRNS